MADSAVEIDIRGLKETQAEMERVVRDMHGDRFLNAMRDATIWVQTDAKENAPVDTGLLRASITPEVRTEGDAVWGVVGSTVHYAPYMETGTKAHWPPLAALETWAARHGTTAYAVARAIARRGIKGRQYLQKAFDANADRIRERLGDVVGEIVGK